MEVILENVRCFAGKHIIPIRPLTILVGENSSGKSTFLAALSAVMDPLGFPMRPSLNEPPYSLGNFDTILTNKVGGAERKPFVSLGHKITSDSADNAATVVAHYWNFDGRFDLFELRITTQVGNLTITRADTQSYKVHLKLSGANKSEAMDFVMDRRLIEDRNLGFATEMAYFVTEWGSKKHIKSQVASEILRIASFVSPAGLLGSSLSIAPIRTKPRRDYDEINQNFTPEGDHIPYVLARVLSEYPTTKERRALITALARFGKESGLFREINVKRRKSGDPFRVMVTIAGRRANIVDVGYGVSQALPIVVQSVVAADQRLLLLQQPEVHLHPKAQAALGSFFVDMLAHSGKRFVVETHSDYIVDRVRMEIADGKLPSDALLILYLERRGTETTVYPITVDSLGNLIGVPPTYRQFFLREEMNLLTRGG